jgi:hypothetical protein
MTASRCGQSSQTVGFRALGAPRLKQGPAPQWTDSSKTDTMNRALQVLRAWRTDIVNRAIMLYEFLESSTSSRARPARRTRRRRRQSRRRRRCPPRRPGPRAARREIRARNLTDRACRSFRAPEPVTDLTAAVAGADRIRYPVMVMAPAIVISGAIRDNTRESGPAAGRRSRGCPRSRPCPRGRPAGYQR